jgi:hypothetical protein
MDLDQIYAGIRAMQSTAEDLLTGSEHFPALNRNLRRIQASLKMLELSVCDPVDLEKRSAA